LHLLRSWISQWGSPMPAKCKSYIFFIKVKIAIYSNYKRFLFTKKSYHKKKRVYCNILSLFFFILSFPSIPVMPIGSPCRYELWIQFAWMVCMGTTGLVKGHSITLWRKLCAIFIMFYAIQYMSIKICTYVCMYSMTYLYCT
jgi:hypothetical protein